MASKDYIYRILARLAYLQAANPVYQDAVSASALYFWLEATIKREAHQEFYRPKSVEELKKTLRDLEAIGVVQGSVEPNSEEPKENDACRWRFAGSLPADPRILRRDGGSGDDPPVPLPPGEGDGGGPGGLAQVLAHPVLFALDEKDLDDALAHAFGANPRDGQESP
jgi:hypothetical protein